MIIAAGALLMSVGILMESYGVVDPAAYATMGAVCGMLAMTK
jgi:hypothetical protein